MSTTDDTDNELLLTEEERAALAGDDDDFADDGADDDGNDGSDEADEGDANGAEDDDDQGDDDGGTGADDGAAREADPADEAPADSSDPAAEVKQPILRAEAPADAEEQLKAIRQEKIELTRQFDEGDLTTAEYHEKLEALEDRRMDIRLAVERAETAAAMERQARENAWFSEVERFLKANPYLADTPLKHAALDTVVRQVTGSEENAGLSNLQMLEKAKAIMHEQLGLAPPKALPLARPQQRRRPPDRPGARRFQRSPISPQQLELR